MAELNRKVEVKADEDDFATMPVDELAKQLNDDDYTNG